MDADLPQMLALRGLSPLGRQGPEGDYGEAFFRGHRAMAPFQLIQERSSCGPQAMNILTGLDSQVHEVIEEVDRPVDQELLQHALHGLIGPQRSGAAR